MKCLSEGVVVVLGVIGIISLHCFCSAYFCALCACLIVSLYDHLRHILRDIYITHCL